MPDATTLVRQHPDPDDFDVAAALAELDRYAEAGDEEAKADAARIRQMIRDLAEAAYEARDPRPDALRRLDLLPRGARDLLDLLARAVRLNEQAATLAAEANEWAFALDDLGRDLDDVESAAVGEATGSILTLRLMGSAAAHLMGDATFADMLPADVAEAMARPILTGGPLVELARMPQGDDETYTPPSETDPIDLVLTDDAREALGVDGRAVPGGCDGRCDFLTRGERTVHDALVEMLSTGTMYGMANLVEMMVLVEDGEADGLPPAGLLEEFVQDHNWPDPPATRRFARSLRELVVAYSHRDPIAR